MTTVVLPEFILKSIEHEITKSCMDVVSFLCREYNLPCDDVWKKLMKHMCIDMKLDSNETYRIVKRKPRKVMENTDTLCIANIFDFDEKCPRRCTNEKIKDKESGKYTCVFCTKHLRMSKVDRLSWGLADEDAYKTYLATHEHASADTIENMILNIQTKNKFLTKKRTM